MFSTQPYLTTYWRWLVQPLSIYDRHRAGAKMEMMWSSNTPHLFLLSFDLPFLFNNIFLTKISSFQTYSSPIDWSFAFKTRRTSHQVRSAMQCMLCSHFQPQCSLNWQSLSYFLPMVSNYPLCTERKTHLPCIQPNTQISRYSQAIISRPRRQ